MVVAKTEETQTKLYEMFKTREVHREYIGLVDGKLSKDGTVNKNIIRHPKHRTIYTTHPTEGRDAVTYYSVIKHIGNRTLCRFILETGRTHQIRVHMKSIGHPLVGDPEYNKKAKKSGQGQELASTRLNFTHPITGKKIDIIQIPSKFS